MWAKPLVDILRNAVHPRLSHALKKFCLNKGGMPLPLCTPHDSAGMQINHLDLWIVASEESSGDAAASL